MALQKQTVNLNFLSTPDSSVSPAVNQQPLEASNLIIDKLGQYTKRYGFDNIGLQVMGTDTVLSNIRYITERRGELLTLSDAGVFKYSAASDKMLQVSQALVTEVEKTSIIRNNYNQSYAQMEVIGGDVVSVYRDSRGGYRYSVLDEASGTLIKNDIALGVIHRPNLLKLNNRLYLFYVRNSDSKVCYRLFETESFGILAEVAMESAITNSTKLFQVEEGTPSKFFLAYVDATGKLSVGFHTFEGLEVGVENAVPNRFTITETFVTGFHVEVELDTEYHFRVLWASGSKIYLRRYSQTGSGEFARVELASYTDMHAITFSVADDIFIAWDKTSTTPQEYIVYGGKWSLTGTQVTAPYIIGAGLGLVSEVFVIDTTRYVATTYTSVFQPNIFVMSEYGSVAAKFNKDSALQHRTENILAVPYSDGTTVRIPMETRTRLQKDGDLFTQTYGVSVFSIVYGQINATSATLDRTLYVSGSIVRDYDGATFAEAGFLLRPDSSVMSATSTAVKATGFISSTGKLTFTAAAFGTGGNSISVSFTAGGTAGSEVVTVVGNAISVQIQSGVSTAAQIKTKLEASASAMALITVVETTSGAMVAPATVTLTSGAGGSLSPGSYLYLAVYSWMDNFGNVHRSGVDTGDAIAFAAALNDRVSVKIPSLFVTDKSDVSIEIYRTQANGTEFYLVGYAINDTSNIYTYYVDTMSDADLADNELIYIAGGVLSNDSIATCKCMTVHDNRLVIGGIEGSDKVFYTKEKTDGEGIGPSDFLSVNTGAKGGDIVALRSFGDVVIVLKETCVGVISGQYATDSGVDVSLKYDLVTEELGCVSKNAIVEIDKGLVFQSERGLCMVGRDLQVAFVGAPVENLRGFTLRSASLITDLQSVVFIGDEGPAICMNYGKNAWTTFPQQLGLASVHVGTDYYFLTLDDRILKRSSTTFTSGGRPVITKIRTPWYQLGGIGGFERLYAAYLQGKVLGEHGFKINVYYDHEEAPRETLVWASGQLQVFGEDVGVWGQMDFDLHRVLQQIRLQPRFQKCTAVSIEVEEWYPDGYSPENSVTWYGIRLEIGMKRGAWKFDSAQAATSLLG
jgi:hypothetical protein